VVPTADFAIETSADGAAVEPVGTPADEVLLDELGSAVVGVAVAVFAMSEPSPAYDGSNRTRIVYTTLPGCRVAPRLRRAWTCR